MAMRQRMQEAAPSHAGDAARGAARQPWIRGGGGRGAVSPQLQRDVTQQDTLGRCAGDSAVFSSAPILTFEHSITSGCDLPKITTAHWPHPIFYACHWLSSSRLAPFVSPRVGSNTMYARTKLKQFIVHLLIVFASIKAETKFSFLPTLVSPPSVQSDRPTNQLHPGERLSSVLF